MLSRRRLLGNAFTLGVVGLALAPASVRGGICGPPQPIVIPSGQQTPPPAVPTNARILILFPGADATIYSTPLHFTATATKVKFDGLTVSLRDLAKRPVPSESVPLAGTTLPILAVRPKAPLQQKTKYQLVVHANAREFILDEFATGPGPQAEAPVTEEVERTRYYTQYPCVGSCAPFAELRFRSPGSASSTLYEVHLLAEDGEVHDGTLRAIVPVTRNPTDGSRHIVVSAGGGCWPQGNFKFPPAGKLQLGIRSVDLAGNTGPLKRVLVDLDHPVHTLD